MPKPKRTQKITLHFDMPPADSRLKEFAAMVSDVIEYARTTGPKCFYTVGTEERPADFSMDEEG